MQLAQINGSGPGWKRKMKLAIICVTYVRKINASSSAFCICCNKHLVYGNAGKKDLLKHATKSTEHLSSKKNYLSTTFLPLHWRKLTSDSSSEIRTYNPVAHVYIIPYGVAGNVQTTATCPSLKENTSRLIVWDRKRHLEAYILSFVAENSLLLSVVIKLIGFFLVFVYRSKGLISTPNELDWCFVLA